jgi:hypothetical protein
VENKNAEEEKISARTEIGDYRFIRKHILPAMGRIATRLGRAGEVAEAVRFSGGIRSK